MKQTLVYYKLIVLDSISIVLSLLLGLIILLKNVYVVDITGFFLLGCIIPIILELSFIIFDVTLVNKSRNEDDIDLGKYQLIFIRGKRRLTKSQKTVLKNLNVLSSLVVLISLIMIFFFNSKSIIEGIILYSLLIIISGCHFYFTDKRI